ncbi:hypothetical protein Tco_0739721, partial [Tanacetum coccineum]
DKIPMVNLAIAFANKGISAFRFEFAGNSDGGDICRRKCGAFYALRFKDVNNVVNISGRFDLRRDYLKRMKQYGFIDVANRKVMRKFVNSLAVLSGFLVADSKNLRSQELIREISTPSSGSKDLVFFGALNQNAVHPLVALENIVFYRERAIGMYLLLPYALVQGSLSQFLFQFSFDKNQAFCHWYLKVRLLNGFSSVSFNGSMYWSNYRKTLPTIQLYRAYDKNPKKD